LLQRLLQFRTGQLLAALQRFGENLLAAGKDHFVQFKLAVAPGCLRDHAGGEEGKEPAGIAAPRQ
jgi:hypothetical protein